MAAKRKIRSSAQTNDKARLAVSEFRKIQPTLTAFARHLTGNPKVAVQVSTGAPRTDGKVIYFQPPIQLGDMIQHERSLCDRRDWGTLAQQCPACQVREGIMSSIYHEIAHIAYDSFLTPDKARIGEAIRYVRSLVKPRYADRIARRIAGSDDIPKSYMELASAINPYFKQLVNCLEDVRINNRMHRARPGTKAMMDAQILKVMVEGVTKHDMSVVKWTDMHLNQQASIGAYLVASGFQVQAGWLSDDVIAAMQDVELQDILSRVADTESVHTSFEVSWEVFTRLRDLGFYQLKEEEQDDDTDEQDEDEHEDASPPPSVPTPPQPGQPSPQQDADDSDDSGEDPGGSDGSGSQEPPDEGGSDAEGEQPEEDADDSAEGSDSGEEDGPEGEVSGESENSDADSSDNEPEADESDSEDGPGEAAPVGEGDDADPADDGEASDEDGASAPEDDGGESDGPEADEAAGSASDDNEAVDGDEGSDARNGADDGGDAGGDEEDGSADSVGDSDEDGEGDSGEPGNPFHVEVEPDEDAESEDIDLDDMGLHAHVEESSDSEDRAIEVAIVQGEYFEKPSSNIVGVNEWRYENMDEDYRERQWHAWNPDLIGTTRGRRLGLSIDKPLESVLGPALMRMRVVFAENKRTHRDRNRKSGRIDARVLGKRAWGDDDRLFGKKTVPGKRDYMVYICIDVSGSTAGKNLQLIKEAAMAQADLCARTGIPFAVYAHTGSPTTMSRFSRNELSVDVYHIKDSNEPWDDRARQRLADIGPSYCNLDGHALEYYRRSMDREVVTHGVILYYSDGKMPLENYHEELEILRREIATCKQKNYTLLGVGIRTDSPRQHGLDTVQVDDSADIIKVVTHLERVLV